MPATAAVAAPAAAEPTAVDAGDHVVVIVPGAEPADAPVTAHGDQIVVPTTDGPRARRKVRVVDDTVKYIRHYGGSRPRVTLQLRHGREMTRKLAAAARVSFVDGALRVEVPRAPGIALPPPATATAPAPQARATATDATAPAADATAPAVVPAAAPATTPADAADATVAAAVSEPPPRALADDARDRGGHAGATAILAILAIGASAGLWWWQRRRGPRAAVTDGDIEVVASRSLGGKARIVLLRAAGREVLLSIGDKGPQLIAQWKRSARGSAGAALATDRTAASADPRPSAPQPITSPAPSVSAPAASPAVAGLLKLRDEKLPPVSPEVATDDADADIEWARELLLATRGGRAA
ncbi:MAG: hypothetical protein D6689_00545 [Deltaproteobacteria bacterium]|nr:MAG: hypothetical protein D6689_00545 [Deltaproteobacteria bacterium]